MKTEFLEILKNISNYFIVHLWAPEYATRSNFRPQAASIKSSAAKLAIFPPNLATL